MSITERERERECLHIWPDRVNWFCWKWSRRQLRLKSAVFFFFITKKWVNGCSRHSHSAHMDEHMENFMYFYGVCFTVLMLWGTLHVGQLCGTCAFAVPHLDQILTAKVVPTADTLEQALSLPPSPPVNVTWSRHIHVNAPLPKRVNLSSCRHQEHVSPTSAPGVRQASGRTLSVALNLKPATPVSPPASPPESEAAGRWAAWRCFGSPWVSGGGSRTCPVGWWFRQSGQTPCWRPGTEPAGPAVAARSAQTHWLRHSSPSVGWDARLEAANSKKHSSNLYAIQNTRIIAIKSSRIQPWWFHPCIKDQKQTGSMCLWDGTIWAISAARWLGCVQRNSLLTSHICMFGYRCYSPGRWPLLLGGETSAAQRWQEFLLPLVPPCVGNYLFLPTAPPPGEDQQHFSHCGQHALSPPASFINDANAKNAGVHLFQHKTQESLRKWRVYLS